MLVTIADAKAHLNIEADDLSDDVNLAAMVLAAQAIVEDAMGRPILGEGGWDADAVPANVVHAVKLVLGELHLKREVSAIKLSTVGLLVGRYSRLSIG
jgi:hypothetical protein